MLRPQNAIYMQKSAMLAHLAPDHVGLSAAVTTAKHEALRAAFGVALNQGEGTLAAAIAPTPHYVHLQVIFRQSRYALKCY